MRILLIDAHETCAKLRTDIMMRKALIAMIVLEQRQQTPMQTLQSIELFPVVAERLPEPKRPQGMNKPRRIDLHRATKHGRR